MKNHSRHRRVRSSRRGVLWQCEGPIRGFRYRVHAFCLMSNHVHPMLFACLLAVLPATVLATDIFGVQDAGLDQPRVNVLLRLTPNGSPLIGTDILGDTTFHFEAFFDTGASGVILSEQTADSFGVQRSTGVLFEDVGIGGSAQFNVSQPLFVDLAPFTPSADIDDPNTAATVYNQRFGPLRPQIGPLGVQNPFFGGTDVLGVPTMQGKVVVMDPKPLNAFDINDPTLAGPMRTYVYNPGTPFKPISAESDPGIPQTNRSVALTLASFSRFTRLTPEGAEGPTQGSNPFIGPNPLAKLDPNTPPGAAPGVTLKLGSKETTSSLLLDTGAAASVISRDVAANLNVRYRPNAPTPILEIFDPAHPEALGTELPDQFVITLAGTGGEQTAAGFFLDSMLVRTREGNPLDDEDPAHLRYLGAPVLVADITLMDPVTLESLTLDGLFAMNFLVASIFLSQPDPFELPVFGDFNPSAFGWVVFDPQNSVLGLDVTAVPEPASFALVLLGLGALALRLRRFRAR